MWKWGENIDLAKACINLKSEEIGNKKSNKESVKIFPMKSKTTKKTKNDKIL